jgi:hypothetical protein
MGTVSPGFKGRGRRTEPGVELPPGQYLVEDFPVLSPDRHRTSSRRTGRDAGPIHETTFEKGAAHEFGKRSPSAAADP